MDLLHPEREDAPWTLMTCSDANLKDRIATYTDYEIYHNWNVSELYYSRRFEQMFYVTGVIVLLYEKMYMPLTLEDEIFDFTHFANVVQSLVTVRAQMRPEDLEPTPDWTTLIPLDTVDLSNKDLFPGLFTGPNFNTLKEKKEHIIPVCANFDWWPVSKGK
ncbi:hypothetical protein Bpfe_001622 [Biomphalaria pfeifferi]|uniref:Uncharacterized protein n=1 Tax=Biomphalaria pfeifferi TaxID=112525 RepID=A0AAD8FMK9_BIOPF|nr:hypothetical protein Bpfe_001622 [Biomphalaria pfeifferi]